MKKLSLVFGAAGLLFAGSAMALPQTKYTSSCKPLAPTEGKYEEGKGVGTISSESAFKKITAGNEAYADGKYNESITILKDLIAKRIIRIQAKAYLEIIRLHLKDKEV